MICLWVVTVVVRTDGMNYFFTRQLACIGPSTLTNRHFSILLNINIRILLNFWTTFSRNGSSDAPTMCEITIGSISNGIDLLESDIVHYYLNLKDVIDQQSILLCDYLSNRNMLNSIERLQNSLVRKLSIFWLCQF